MLAETAVISLLTAKVRKGRFENFYNFNIRAGYLFIIGLLIQSLPILFEIIKIHQIGDKYFFYIHLLSYVLIFITLIMNFSELSFKFIFLGTFLNFVAIFTNGGYMPVSMSSIIATGYKKISKITNQIDYKHILMTTGTNLKALADIIPSPKLYPFRQILSIGDLFIMVGAFILIQNLMVKRQNK